jgi:hypothetical protein
MSKKRFETGKAPQVTIDECHGQLTISGGAEAVIIVSGNDYEAAESDKGVSISSRGSLALRIPQEATLLLQSLHGNLAIKNVAGAMHLSEIRGNLSMKNVGAVEVETIQGDLVGKNINGAFVLGRAQHDVALRNTADLQIGDVQGDLAVRYVNGRAVIQQVMGDVSLRTINGDLTIQHARRDANLRNLGGINQVENISGDIRLVGGLAGGKHQFKAGGDIVVHWPTGAPLNLTATAPKISNRLDLENVSQEGNTMHGRIDEGETTLLLEAEKRIYLKKSHSEEGEFVDINIGGNAFSFDFDLENLGEKISAQLDSRLTDMAERWETAIGPEVARKIEVKAQAAAKRAEAAAEQAVRRAEQALKQSRWQHEGRVWTPPPPPAAAAPTSKAKKASDEERLKILSMVEKGIISPEEASTLLDALG